jgi:hypothetical protein
VASASLDSFEQLVKIKTFKYSFRYSNILNLPRVRTSTYGKKSFKFAACQRAKIKVTQNKCIKYSEFIQL